MSQSPAFTLRALQFGDAPRIAELIGDWEVVRWLSLPPYPYVVGDAETFLARLLAAELSAGCRTDAIIVHGALAGVVSVEPRDAGINLGYWLGRSWWGRGIMSAATTKLVGDFFAKSEETTLTSGYFSGNEASWAIQKRLGFVAAGDTKLFNRPYGRHLPHIDTVLPRARFESLNGALSKVGT
jgi:RimJ/RimL family protein N-acetyltransferase